MATSARERKRGQRKRQQSMIPVTLRALDRKISIMPCFWRRMRGRRAQPTGSRSKSQRVLPAPYLEPPTRHGQHPRERRGSCGSCGSHPRTAARRGRGRTARTLSVAIARSRLAMDVESLRLVTKASMLVPTSGYEGEYPMRASYFCLAEVSRARRWLYSFIRLLFFASFRL